MTAVGAHPNERWELDVAWRADVEVRTGRGLHVDDGGRFVVADDDRVQGIRDHRPGDRVRSRHVPVPEESPCGGEDAEQGAPSARIVGHRRYASAAMSAATSRSDSRSANDVLTVALDDGGLALAIGFLRRADDEERGEQREPESPAVAPNRTRSRRFCRRSCSSWVRIGLVATRPILSRVEESVSVEVRSGLEAERQSSVFWSRTPR